MKEPWVPMVTISWIKSYMKPDNPWPSFLPKDDEFHPSPWDASKRWIWWKKSFWTFDRKPMYSGHLPKWIYIWSNYSDLTRPHSKNGGLVREMFLFQGNPGGWNIIIWPDLYGWLFFVVNAGYIYLTMTSVHASPTVLLLMVQQSPKNNTWDYKTL